MKNITIILRSLKLYIFSLGLILSLCTQISAQTTYTVINNNETGAGSLRQAIIDANGDVALDNIEFNIPVVGPHTIILTGLSLPAITTPINIDATTQSGYTIGNPQIMINGDGHLYGFELTSSASGSTINGFSLVNFSYAIYSDTSGNHNFNNNFIGLQPDGATVLPNLFGIRLVDSSNNTFPTM